MEKFVIKHLSIIRHPSMAPDELITRMPDPQVCVLTEHAGVALRLHVGRREPPQLPPPPCRSPPLALLRPPALRQPEHPDQKRGPPPPPHVCPTSPRAADPTPHDPSSTIAATHLHPQHRPPPTGAPLPSACPPMPTSCPCQVCPPSPDSQVGLKAQRRGCCLRPCSLTQSLRVTRRTPQRAPGQGRSARHPTATPQSANGVHSKESHGRSGKSVTVRGDPGTEKAMGGTRELE